MLNNPKTKNKRIIYNEIDPFMVSLFKMIKDKNQSFISELDKLTYLKDNQILDRFNNLKSYFSEGKWKNENDITEDKLLDYVFYRLTVFRGCIDAQIPNKKKDKIQLITKLKIKKIKDLNIDNLEIENKNVLDLIEEYKGNNRAFIFLDPPYVSTRKSINPYKEPVKFNELLDYINNPDIKYYDKF